MPTDYVQEPHWANWMIVLEMFVAGIAAGTYFAYALMGTVGRRADRSVWHLLGFIPAPVLLLVAILLIVDLGQPLRFLNLFITSPSAVPERGGPFFFNTMSPMTWGSYLIGVFGVFAAVAFIDSLLHRGERARQGLLTTIAHNPIWLLIGGIFALVTGAYSGVLVNVSQVPVWTETLWLGALYVSMAALSGMGVAAIVADRRGATATASAVREALLYVAIVNLVLVALFLANLAVAGRAGAVALEPTVAPIFWIGVVILGLIVPAWIVVRRHERLAVAGALALLGALAFRYTVLFAAVAALHS